MSARYCRRIALPRDSLTDRFFSFFADEAPGFVHWWRRSSLGGSGKKFVIILAANVGGGVTEWKGAREWAIERDSVRNKRQYTRRWGYDLEIVDMKTRKRYAHEWRESWEKVDFLREALRKYPQAEWYACRDATSLPFLLLISLPLSAFSLTLASLFPLSR